MTVWWISTKLTHSHSYILGQEIEHYQLGTLPMTIPFSPHKGDHSYNIQHHRLSLPVFELLIKAIIMSIFFDIWLLDFLYLWDSFILLHAVAIQSFSLLTIIPLYEYTTIYFSSPIMDIGLFPLLGSFEWSYSYYLVCAFGAHMDNCIEDTPRV